MFLKYISTEWITVETGYWDNTLAQNDVFQVNEEKWKELLNLYSDEFEFVSNLSTTWSEMTKEIYDSNNDWIVNEAEKVDWWTF